MCLEEQRSFPLAQDSHIEVVSEWYDVHPINEQQILEKLEQDDVDTSQLSEDILQNYDQDHFGGVEANDELARLAGLDENCHLLDVCSGMGGPARYQAHNYGCRVTGIDLTESRVAGAIRLTEMVGLSDRVTFQCANALDNHFPDRSFDVVISQEAFCHIPKKSKLVNECVRVLKTGGRMAFTDIVKRDRMTDQARDRLQNEMMFTELETQAGYGRLLEREGCKVMEMQDVSEHWAEILVARLAMYRSLRSQTVAHFGAAHFEKWDNAYDHFVGLVKTGELGGCRFLARRN
ncbi:MAG: methyltransferase domain-containing protein [Rhodospirillaceae bacterium]|nr:methyltransferase domain-containing protein [Rhodospirillaceae bacterium]MBT3767033.1 methyltransferase domain-containing protein [Rhodospirillales bacterium]MBT5081946.1 methyltransferase domain-containing protein [Rhodospirillaceae bacterium]MBT5877628.1 methyltransferase domain-containing protein [Rhodospirillaceae bacterium]MBT6592067.1 methyltransferase domain-containing protein [Rhodospirillaceae bacterium]